jgi:hypothetical protein
MTDFKVGDVVKYVYKEFDLDCRVEGIRADLYRTIAIKVIKVYAKPAGSAVSCGNCWNTALATTVATVTLLTDIDDFPIDLDEEWPIEPAHTAGLDREEIDRAAYDDFMRSL